MYKTVNPVVPVFKYHCQWGDDMAKILIVDDEQSILETLDMFLSEKGYQVYTAPTGKEGFALFCQEIHIVRFQFARVAVFGTPHHFHDLSRLSLGINITDIDL